MKLKKIWCLVLLIFMLFLMCGPENNSIQILPLTDQTIPAQRAFVMNINAINSSGQTLQWSFSPSDITNAQLFPAESGATFRWTPMLNQIGSHTFTFTASTTNESSSVSVTLTVIQAEGAPVFVKPSDEGNTYDLSIDSCIKVEIEIRDDDSLSVDINESEPKIETATLEKLGQMKSLWTWCPTPQQIAASDRYTLHLEADDGDHGAVTKDYDIIFLRESKPNCPGELPVIESLTPPLPETVSTIRDFEVNITVSDDNGIKDPPILYYTMEQPADPDKVDITQMKQITFEKISGALWHAFIPNMIEGLEEKTIYYIVSVTDNDDPQGTGCDHIITSELRQFNVRLPENPDPAPYCYPCSKDSQCDNGMCVISARQFCGTNCSDSCSQGSCQEVSTVDGAMVNLCVPENLDCSGFGVCEDDSFDQSGGNNSRNSATPVTVGDTYELAFCKSDIDYYSINVNIMQPIEITISGWDIETSDIDLKFARNNGDPIYSSESNGPVEKINLCLTSVSNPYYIIVDGLLWSSNRAPYTMSIKEGTGECCEDDQYESNDDKNNAIALFDLNAHLCTGNEDWYSFTITEPKHAKIDVLYDFDQGDVDAELYRFDSSTSKLILIDSQFSSDDDELIDKDLYEKGAYYLRIFSFSSINNDYSLAFELTNIVNLCSDSSICEAGDVCDIDSGMCIDDECDSQHTCSYDYFCPEVPDFASESSCVTPCTDNNQCRNGYFCKPFREGKGCALIRNNNVSGDSCTTFEDCGGERICLNTEGGYCAKVGCTKSEDCPSDSFCVNVNLNGTTEKMCLRSCWNDNSECRLDRGQSCETASEDFFMIFVCIDPDSMTIVN